MMMFIHFLVFTCACALGAADEVPPYGHIVGEIIRAYNLLNENILSMDGNAPLLNDSRRHYAEIMYVVNDEALHEKSCLSHDYYRDYQRNINVAAPFAIANPQMVVDRTKEVITDILNNISEVLQLVNNVTETDNPNSDRAIAEEVKRNNEKYETSTEIFLAAGIFATQLNRNDKDYFAPISQDLSAHNFVITGASELEKTVMALTNLYRLLYRYRC